MGYKRNLVIGCMFGAVHVSLFAMYGSKLINADPLFDRGTIFTVFFAVMTGSMSLGSALPQYSCIAVALGTAKSIFDIIDTKSLIDSTDCKGLTPSKICGKLEFHDVCFSYPSRKTIKVLKCLNFSVLPGQTVALVGPIPIRLRSNVEIIIDGFDLRSLQVRSLRTLIGIVSQEPVLFDGSIEENIRLGNQDATTDEIIEASKVANVYAFINNLPQVRGLHFVVRHLGVLSRQSAIFKQFATRVGQQGVQLSGGQKQRIAIARALVRNPKILLLDEATSALDTQSEEIVQDALNRAQQGRTTIIVAHRLSTIKD
ncbi:unnamed protein product, partial [Soboliphyme baturini]|uniref:ABC transporter domain-containing protein n=1 Tax=Soboliphyme baturini TaxID=241478 RepID=A0A183I949_9BILA